MLPFSKPFSLQSTVYSGQNLIYKSTSFLPLESTIYSLLFIDYDLQIYRFLLKLDVDSTAQNEPNLQSTFDVPPPHHGYHSLEIRNTILYLFFHFSIGCYACVYKYGIKEEQKTHITPYHMNQIIQFLMVLFQLMTGFFCTFCTYTF